MSGGGKRLAPNNAVVRRRMRPAYAECRLTLSFFTEVPGTATRRRLALVFAPSPTGPVSNTYLESGTVLRLPGRSHLSLYEPGTARRLLEAAASAGEPRHTERNVEPDGWPFFAAAVDR